MHIEPGIVDATKIGLSYVTAGGAALYAAKLCWTTMRESGAASLIARCALATVAVFVFFEVLPHFSAGVSEVHFILGSSLFLILGAGPAAVGLAMGLVLQSTLLAPTDLPQYAMNVTTLLVPLFALQAIAARIFAPGTAYVDLSYVQVAKLSASFQAGTVAWVGFWAIYGQGVGADNLSSIVAFGGVYMLVVLIEPLVDLGLLAGAKAVRDNALFTPRLHNAA